MRQLKPSDRVDSPDREGNTVLIVDDDPDFLSTLQSAMSEQGFQVCTAEDVESALDVACAQAPDYAVVDLRLAGDSALRAVTRLHALSPRMHIVVLSGFASIQTAIAAIRLSAAGLRESKVPGAQVADAGCGHRTEVGVAPEPQAKPVRTVESEYLQRVLREHQGNISETARILGMHRRTLQRKLARARSVHPGERR